MPSKPRRHPDPQPFPKPPLATAPLPLWRQKAAELGRSPFAFLIVSILVLIPANWQSHIQAGDLSSHIYNAWLAQLIEKGQAPGLALARQTTNILFDLMLGTLMPMFGAEAAQRISVSLAVLAFVWGSFAFVSVAAHRRAWSVMPLIVMLAYGWVFHIGFFNFYLSLGLSFGAMALLWELEPKRIAAATLLFAIAYLAHALPVVWAIALLAYRWLALRLPSAQRWYLLAGTAAAMLVARTVIGSFIQTQWFSTQVTTATGLDQLWIFDPKYLLVCVGLLLAWVLPLISLVRQSGGKVFAEIPFHLCVLASLGILIFPSWVAVPGYKHALAFIAERLSLGLGICICALVATASIRAWQQALAAVVGVLFFVFLFVDESGLNAFEARLERMVVQLPPNQRVITAIDAPGLRVNAIAHMIDRVCVGRCYSYANYEPSTAQFRVRVTAPNPIVVAVYEDSWRMQGGTYVVRPQDVPLYEISLDANQKMGILTPPAGATTGLSYYEGPPAGSR